MAIPSLPASYATNNVRNIIIDQPIDLTAYLEDTAAPKLLDLMLSSILVPGPGWQGLWYALDVRIDQISEWYRITVSPYRAPKTLFSLAAYMDYDGTTDSLDTWCFVIDFYKLLGIDRPHFQTTGTLTPLATKLSNKRWQGSADVAIMATANPNVYISGTTLTEPPYRLIPITFTRYITPTRTTGTTATATLTTTFITSRGVGPSFVVSGAGTGSQSNFPDLLTSSAAERPLHMPLVQIRHSIASSDPLQYWQQKADFEVTCELL